MRLSFYPDERMMRALWACLTPLIRAEFNSAWADERPGSRASFAAVVEEIRASNLVKERLLFHVRRGFIMRASVQANFGGLYERVGHS